MSEIEYLESASLAEFPPPRRRVTIWAIMMAILGVALILAFVRGWELGCGVVVTWGAALLALVEVLTRATGRPRLRIAAIVAILYPWLALVAVGSLLAAREANRPDPVLAEIITILVRAICAGVPGALMANYYLVLAEAYPVGTQGGASPPPGGPVRPLVLASVASWTLGLATLIAGLVLTA